MTRDLFRTISDPPASQSWRARSVPASIAAHGLILAALAIVPLLVVAAPATLPYPHRNIAYLPAASVPAAERTTLQTRDRQATAEARPDLAPITAPDTVGEEKEIPTPVGDSSGVGVSGGIDDLGTSGTGVPWGTDTAAPLPPELDPVAKRTVRAGGAIVAPRKIVHVAPDTPAIARHARVEGIVIIEATVDESGTVQSARVLRSVSLLDEAALGAVRQWRFTPTRLNGAPVSVILTVTVNFALKE